MTEPRRRTATELEAQGFDLSPLTDEQREVLQELSDEELALLTDVRTRMQEVAPDVQVHSEVAGAGLF
jgi:hypothetical protein